MKNIFKHTREIEPPMLVNIDFCRDTLKKRKGWKSFKGMVYQMKLLNNRYKKLGIVGNFTIRLPLK